MTADDTLLDDDKIDPADCRYCCGTGVVLNGDGRPGWKHPRICFHNRSWRLMTPPERAQHGELLARLNKNPTPETSPPALIPDAVRNAETPPPPSEGKRQAPRHTTPPRKDLDD